MVQNGVPLPSNLPGPPLSARDAIADAAYRAFSSIDQSSLSLLASAVTPDVFTDIASKQCNGYDELVSKVWTHVSENVDTLHYLSNVRVSVDSETTGRVTFLAQAVHCPLGKGYDTGERKFVTGAFYECEAVKVQEKGEESGLWKLRTMKSTHVWCTGDHSVMRPAPVGESGQ